MTGPGEVNCCNITAYNEASEAFQSGAIKVLVPPLTHGQIWEGDFSRSAVSVCLPKHYSRVTVNFLYLWRHKDLLK